MTKSILIESMKNEYIYFFLILVFQKSFLRSCYHINELLKEYFNFKTNESPNLMHRTTTIKVSGYLDLDQPSLKMMGH